MSHSIPLSEITKVNPPRPTIALDPDDEVSFVPMSDVSESGRWDSRQVRRFGEVSRGYTYFAENDVLFAKITPCTENGKGCHATDVRNGIGFASTEFHVLRATEVGDPGFVYQWSIYSPLRLKAAAVMTGSAGQQRVPASFFDSFQIPQIEKDEQSKIAEILSTVDRAIEQTEGLIAKQQRIKTGLMQDLLTRGIDEQGNLRSDETHQFKDSPLGRIPVEWKVKPIEQKLDRIIDYRGRTPTKVEAGVPLLTAKNVRDGYIKEEPREFIAESAFDAWMTRGIPKPGDVLFSTEAPMGNVARIPEYRIALAQRLLTLSPKPRELSQDYLFWLLHWQRSTERLELLTSGSTVLGVKQSVFRKVEFRFPKFDEQQQISAILNSHDRVCAVQKVKFRKLHSLKTALMQDLLTGEKRVTPLLEPGVTT
jgi:type I restriction enzyme S subunit